MLGLKATTVEKISQQCENSHGIDITQASDVSWKVHIESEDVVLRAGAKLTDLTKNLFDIVSDFPQELRVSHPAACCDKTALSLHLTGLMKILKQIDWTL